MKGIQDGMNEEAEIWKEKKAKREVMEKRLTAEPVTQRRTGPWRILEIFTWTCMVTMTADKLGWEAFEPITEPGWNLNLSGDRAKARTYLKEVDPGFVVLAPPCGPWSPIQLINQRTPLQVRELKAKRAKAMELLLFVEEVVQYQHQRGRAVVVENPQRSLLWAQAPIMSAFALPGMVATVADMCMYEKRRPDTKELVRKPTVLKGTAIVCEEVRMACDGSHRHGP
jgi:hypothetical protein